MKSDLELQRNVIEELRWDPSVKAESIGVEVSEGIVTLAGHVGTYGEKWGAERAAQRVAEVKAVVVEVDVQLPGFHKRTDVELARSIENTLQWTAYLPKDSIKILVDGGHVTLSGEVDWDYQRRLAQSSIRYMFGVTGVSNRITVKHDPSTSMIKSDIERALRRRSRAKDTHVSVDVHGHDVSLTGTVPSWWERQSVLHVAWGTSGVWDVTDNMTITR